MEDGRKLIADSYGEVMDAEFDAILLEAGEEPHRFSERFKKNMEEILNGESADENEAPPARHGLRRVRRIILIAAAVAAVLAVLACAVPAIRESIAGFLVKTFGDHVEYVEPDITKTSIEEEYGLVPIPEGYSVTRYMRYEKLATTVYDNEDGNSITLNQAADKAFSETVDNEHGESFEIEIDGKNVLVHTGGGTHAAWVENGYYFALSTPIDLELNELKSLIELVKIK